MLRKVGTTLVLVVALVVGASLPAAAEPGDLDGTFGACGIAAAKVLPNYETLMSPAELIRQPSGMIVQAFGGPNGVASLHRFQRNGRVDRTFGLAGEARPPIRLEAPRNHSVFQTATGRIYVTGRLASGEGAIAALTVDGQPDPTFGIGGLVTLADGIIWSAGAQHDGRLLIVHATSGVVHIERLTLDGSVDPTFAAVDPAIVQNAYSLDIGTNDEVVIMTLASGIDWLLPHVLRLDRDGSLISSYALSESIPNDNSTDFDIPVLTPLSDGSVIITRNRQTYSDRSGRTVVSKFLPTGSVDPSFGNGGRISVRINGSSWTTNTAVLADGEIALLVRDSPLTLDRPMHFGLQFRLPTGALDTTRTGPTFFFSNGGRDARVFGLTSSQDTVAIGFASPSPNGTFAAIAKFSLDQLRVGAGLMLQWDGTAWPSRLAGNPGPECPYDTPYWPDNDNARGITTVPGQGGYVVDLFGGIHPFSIGRQRPAPAAPLGGPYWPGWNIVRGIAAKSDGAGGYVLDAYGALHSFHTGTNPQPAQIVNGPYWPGWDIARSVALMPDGNRGYILDGFGGVHRFTTPGHSLPPALNHTAYWPGWDIARGISILGDGTGGYIVDAYGGVHPFGIGTHPPPPSPAPSTAINYVPGNDWVRGFSFIDPLPPAASIRASERSAGAGETRPLDDLRAAAGISSPAESPTEQHLSH